MSARIEDDGSVVFNDYDGRIYQWPAPANLARDYWAYWRKTERERAADEEMIAESAVADLMSVGDKHALVVVQALIALAVTDELNLVGAGPLYDLAIWKHWALLDQAIVISQTDHAWRHAMRQVILDGPDVPPSSMEAFERLRSAT